MTTSPMSLKSVICLDDQALSPAQLGYFSARAQSDAHELLLSTFLKAHASDSRVTKAFIARRMGKKPEQVSRWFGAPGNVTVATFAELLASMGYAPTFGASCLKELAKPNEPEHPLSGARYSMPPAKAIKGKIPHKDTTGNVMPGFISTKLMSSQPKEVRSGSSNQCDMMGVI